MKTYIFYFDNPLKLPITVKGLNVYDALRNAGFKRPENVFHSMIISYRVLPVDRYIPVEVN